MKLLFFYFRTSGTGGDVFKINERIFTCLRQIRGALDNVYGCSLAITLVICFLTKRTDFLT